MIAQRLIFFCLNDIFCSFISQCLLKGFACFNFKKKKPLNLTMIQNPPVFSVEKPFLTGNMYNTFASFSRMEKIFASFPCFFLKRDETTMYIEIMTVNSKLQ